MQPHLFQPWALSIDQQVGSKGGTFAYKEQLLKAFFLLS